MSNNDNAAITDEMLAWQRILLSKAVDISYRLVSRQPTQIFYKDLADELESVVKRIRRNIKD